MEIAAIFLNCNDCHITAYILNQQPASVCQSYGNVLKQLK